MVFCIFTLGKLKLYENEWPWFFIFMDLKRRGVGGREIARNAAVSGGAQSKRTSISSTNCTQFLTPKLFSVKVLNMHLWSTLHIIVSLTYLVLD